MIIRGIVYILRACDRRIGKKRLQILLERTRSEKVRSIIKKRIMKNKKIGIIVF